EQNQLLHFTIPLSQDEFKITTVTLREDLLDVTKTAQVKQKSQQLYSWLIEPLETALMQNQIDTLVFVLDGSLRNLPMSVLYDGKQQQYLIEKYAIAVAPGLQLVKSQAFSPTKLNVLTAGISQQRMIAGQDFSSLANVEQELQQIQSQVNKSQQLIDQDFTTANLQNRLKETNFSTVHLATHGKFSSNPEQTFILTWNQLLKTQDLANLMRQHNLSENDAIELLVLSACETATGDPLAALGLAGIAVKAGVRSTLASLWFADDQYSAEIMSSFYQELSQGTTKAKALQKAQIAVLKQEKRPYLWSSFILLGDWL
ncbi:MAG: CHAT domain-containing protein, partial [Candidatus Nanopelagicaceae bacterium]